MESVAVGAVLLLLSVAIWLIPVAIGVVAVSAFRQAKLRRAGTPLTPLVADAITRSTIANARAMFLTSIILATALYVTGDEEWALLITPIPITRALRLVLARRFLDYIETHTGPVTLHGNLLAVHIDRYILVPRSIARTAARPGVPVAISRG